MTAVAAPPQTKIEVNQLLLDATIKSVQKGLSMAGLEARCVGVSSVPDKQSGSVTGMIGVHGDVSGFVTANMSERMALQAVSGLLQEDFDALSPQVVDGVGEVANIVVGGLKTNLASSEWAFRHMTVPSVIVGEGYQVAFARGLELLDVTFEVENELAILVSDRLLHVTLSLLKL